MKKNKFIRALKWLQDAGLKALIILLLVVGGYYVLADVVWPAGNPTAVTGVVGMFVGESTNAFGGVTGTLLADRGYDLVNAYCSAGAGDLLGSHICTPDEMLNSYNHNPSVINAFASSPSLWINSGPPGFLASAKDCFGWTVTTPGPDSDQNFGAIWMFGTNRMGGLTTCNIGRKFACCK